MSNAAKGTPEKLASIMERAAAKRAGKKLPVTKREAWKPPPQRSQTRVDVHGNRKTTPPDINENIIRVMRADPIGFLIAVMDGLPIPRRVANDEGRAGPVEYVTADVVERVLAAEKLLGYIPVSKAKEIDKRVKPKITSEMERLVENAANSSELEEGQD